MARETALLEVADPLEREGWIRLSARLVPPGGSPREAWFEFESPDGWTPPRRARPFALAFLPLAMRRGWELRCADRLDPATLANLAEWQAVYAHWFPWSLEHVPIAATPGADVVPRLGGSVLGFSGGVDSTAVLVRRRHGQGTSQPPIAAGVLIHGFDIPLSEEGAHGARWESAERVLRRFGARGIRLRTNLRSLARKPYLDWAREVHGIWLASALSCLEPWYDELVVASSDINRRLELPWGSNPITDRLLSGEAARMVNEGGELTRMEKLAFLAGMGACGELRVCYERPESGHNCGRCRKCLFLQLGLEALGLEYGCLFPAGTDIPFRRSFRTSRPFLREFLAEMASVAASGGRPALAAELRDMSAPNPLLVARDLLRRWVRRLR